MIISKNSSVYYKKFIMFHVNFVGFIRMCHRLLRDPHSWVYVDVQWQQDGTAVILIDNVAWFAYKPRPNSIVNFGGFYCDEEWVISSFKERLFNDMNLD